MEKKNQSDQKIKIGIYKHFKGNKYEVLFTALNSENKQEMIAYRDLKDKDKIWLRPKEMFLEKVKVDNGEVKRFQFLSDSSEEHDYEGRYKRALADYQNLLKQTVREKEDFAKYANESLIREIIPVYDNLKTSMLHAGEEENNNWLIGIKYVIKQFKDFLESFGVKEIETKGKKFDPNLMEAIEGQGEKVKKEVRSGYILKDKVIIPAGVIVE